MRMCPESENLNLFAYIFSHGYLTYYSTYLLENLYVGSLDVSGGKGLKFVYSAYFLFY